MSGIIPFIGAKPVPDLAETDVEPFEVLQVKTLSSDLRSLVSSFIRYTAAMRFSFSSNSDSRKALRSMAALSRASKSSKDAMVLL